MEQTEPGASPAEETGGGRAAHLRERVDSGKHRFDESALGEIWRRLSELDFINQALMLAGTMVLWLIPSMLVLDRIRGRSTIVNVSRRMGLDDDAAARLERLFRPSSPSAAVTISAVVVLAFGLLGAAGAVQRLYELVFDLQPRGFRDFWRKVVWPVATIAGVSALAYVHRGLEGHTGGLVLAAIVDFAVLAAYFGWSMHFLLAGRVPWATLSPRPRSPPPAGSASASSPASTSRT